MKRLMLIVLVIATGLVSGCQAEKDFPLEGRWIQKVDVSSGQKPRKLDIARDQNVVRVDESVFLDGQYKVLTEVGQQVSDTAITVKNGLRTIRFENGMVSYRNSEFVRAE